MNHRVKVIRVLWRMNRGGAETRALDVMRNIDRNAYQIEYVVLSGQKGAFDQEITSLGGKVHYLKQSLSFPFRFYQLLRREKPDCVHSQMTRASGYVLKIASLAGIKNRIVSFHNMTPRNTRNKLKKAYEALMLRWIDKYSTSIIGVNEESLATCFRRNWRDDPRCKVVYQGIDLEQQKVETTSTETRNTLGLSEEHKVIISIGNYRNVKNQMRQLDIIQACLKIDTSARLVIVGGTHDCHEGEVLQEKLQKEIQKRDLSEHVILTGCRTDTRRLIAASDLLIATSFSEGCANVIWEALGNGVPVLSSSLPIIDELKGEFSGVEALHLNEPDDRWATDALLLIGKYKQATMRQLNCSEFKDSSLSIEKAVIKYEDLWRNGSQVQASRAA